MNEKERQEIMNTSEVLKIVDHTLLTQTATWEDIKTILDDGIKYETASACIPAAYVKQAAEYVEENFQSVQLSDSRTDTAQQQQKYSRQKMRSLTEHLRSTW